MADRASFVIVSRKPLPGFSGTVCCEPTTPEEGFALMDTLRENFRKYGPFKLVSVKELELETENVPNSVN